MFRAQHGCLAVFFTRTETECATMTVWDSEKSVKEMEASPLYQQVVGQIEQSGILGNDHQTRVFSVYGGFVRDELPNLISSSKVGT
jgi:heme-degrading monooxygenase HmoA